MVDTLIQQGRSWPTLIKSPAGLPRRGLVLAHDLVALAETQSVPSLFGLTQPLQRGSTSGADSADFALGASGAVFTTDDYGLTENLAGVTMAGDWTAILVHAGLQRAANYAWSISVAGSYRSHNITGNATGIRISTNDATTERYSDIITTDASAVQACVLWQSSGTLYLKSMDAGQTVSLTGQPSAGAVRIGLMCQAASTPRAIMTQGTIPFHAFYNRALSTAEIARAYRFIKARMAAKGIVVL